MSGHILTSSPSPPPLSVHGSLVHRCPHPATNRINNYYCPLKQVLAEVIEARKHAISICDIGARNGSADDECEGQDMGREEVRFDEKGKGCKLGNEDDKVFDLLGKADASSTSTAATTSRK
eukprot:scaffold2556_cov207-Alexandrium_tamarense.AAC.1